MRRVQPHHLAFAQIELGGRRGVARRAIARGDQAPRVAAFQAQADALVDGDLRSGHRYNRGVAPFGRAREVSHAVVDRDQRDALPGGQASVIG